MRFFPSNSEFDRKNWAFFYRMTEAREFQSEFQSLIANYLKFLSIAPSSKFVEEETAFDDKIMRLNFIKSLIEYFVFSVWIIVGFFK